MFYQSYFNTHKNMLENGSLSNTDQMGSISNFDNLFKEMTSLFDEWSKLHPDSYSHFVDDAFNQIKSETTDMQLKPTSVMKSPPKAQTNILEKTRKIQIALTALLLTTCLLIVGVPIFYDSSEGTVISSFLSNPYVQIVLPKEYSYQLGVFYMNLRSGFARIVRRFATYMGSQRIFGLFGIKGNDHDKICFVSNPMFKKETPQPCSLCHGAEQTLYHSSPLDKDEEKDMETTLADGNIHIFEQSGQATSLHILQQHISTNPHAIGVKQHSFESNIDYVTSVKDLGLKQTISHLLYDMPASGHIVWSTDHYTISRVMRQVFPRPPVIPTDIGITMNKAILLDGPKSPEYRLPVEKPMFTLYIQGFGSRIIRLVPPADCVVKCNTHTVVTQTGDVLVYDALIWTAYSLPSQVQRSFAYITHLLIAFEDQ